MKNLIFLEAQSSDKEHLSFNAATLNATKSDAEMVYIYAHKSHLKALNPLLKIERFYFPISALPKGLIQRVAHFFKNYLYLPRIEGDSELIILSMSAVQLVLVPLYLFKYKSIVIYHHGLTENLLSTSFLVRTIFRLIYSYLGSFPTIKNNFLGGHIREGLSRINLLKDNFYFLRLPHEIQVINHSLYPKKEGFKVVTFGLQTFEKGFLDNLWLWDRLRDHGVDCRIVGFANKEVLSYLTGVNQHLILNEKMCDHQKLILEIQNADIIFFTYPQNLYKLTSSGAYFDAVSYQKKIFAYAGNDFFEYEKNLNMNLQLCADKDQMLEKILHEYNNKYIKR